MPRSNRYRIPVTSELPGTLRRSPPEAQSVFRQAHEDAVRAYGEGDQAHRAAYAALKKQFEKCGDRWIAKAEPAA